MKKLISVLLSFAMLIPAFCLTVSASEESTEKDKLFELLDAYKWETATLGNPRIYMMTDTEYTNALNVYEDPNSTNEDYVLACDEFLNACLNFDVYREYAEATYEMALKEENYNNWYSDEEWENFQSKLEELGNVIDALDDSTSCSNDLTNAFHNLLKSYNDMTNSYTIKGDLNKDGIVNIADVTLLQKYLVGAEKFTGAQKMLTGAYNYENLSITDATVLQKYIVQAIEEIPNNNVFVSDFGAYCMDGDLLLERSLNFNICSRILPEAGVRSNIYNGYMGIGYLYSYYYFCYENNCEP